MLAQIILKIRNMIHDNAQSTYETFTAGSGRTFTISQENASTVTSVTVNGTALATDKYTYTSATQTVTINSGYVSSTQIVVIYFTYYKYSDTELTEYVVSALSFLDINKYSIHFDKSSTDIFPYPTPKESNLIAYICYLLIEPSYSDYRVQGISVSYPKKLTKEEAINEAIKRFKRNEGTDVIIERL